MKKTFWLLLVIGLEIGLVTLYAMSVHANGGEPAAFLDVNGFRSVPSWFQATQIFLIGAVPFWLFVTYRPFTHQKGVPPSRFLLGVIAVLFFYASLDELFKFNILFHQHQLWKSIYLALGLMIPMVFYRDLIRLCRFSPRSMRLIGVGIIIFLICGFGLDFFRVHVQQRYWYQLFGRWQFYQVDSIRTALEEFGEMLGETLILKAMLDLARQRRKQLDLLLAES